MLLAIDTIPVPVSMNLPISVWVAWISSIAIGLGGLVAISKFIAKASKIASVMPVLMAIANEFKSDSGSTLRDSVNRIEKATNDAKQTAIEAKQTAGLAKLMSEDLRKLLLDQRK